MSKYAVVTTKTIFIPGDERSRSNPGHGYPASSEQYNEFITFDNEDKLKTWIISHSRDTFKVIKYDELQFDISLDVKIK